MTPEERTKVVADLARLTGLPKAFIANNDLRITLDRFSSELMRDQHRGLSNSDARVTGFIPAAAGGRADQWRWDTDLPPLLRTLDKELTDVHWLRLMYAYPSCFTDEMIDTVASATWGNPAKCWASTRPSCSIGPVRCSRARA